MMIFDRKKTIFISVFFTLLVFGSIIWLSFSSKTDEDKLVASNSKNESKVNEGIEQQTYHQNESDHDDDYISESEIDNLDNSGNETESDPKAEPVLVYFAGVDFKSGNLKLITMTSDGSNIKEDFSWNDSTKFYKFVYSAKSMKAGYRKVFMAYSLDLKTHKSSLLATNCRKALFNPDCDVAVIEERDQKTVFMVNIETGDKSKVELPPFSRVNKIIEGNYLIYTTLSESDKKQIKVFKRDLNNQKSTTEDNELFSFEGPSVGSMREDATLYCSSNGRIIGYLSAAKRIDFYDTAEKKVISTVDKTFYNVLSPDGKYCAHEHTDFNAIDKTSGIIITETATGKQVKIDCHKNHTVFNGWSPDSKYLYVQTRLDNETSDSKQEISIIPIETMKCSKLELGDILFFASVAY